MVSTVIIGSGMAGASIAEEFLNIGHTDFAVVSTGGLGNVRHYPATGWNSSNENYQPVPGTEGLLGGRAQLWSGVVLPLADEVLAEWPTGVASALAAAYPATLARLEDWKGSSIGAPTCPNDQLFLERMSCLGRPFSIVPMAATDSGNTSPEGLRAYCPLDGLSGRIAVCSRPEMAPYLLYAHRVLSLDSIRGRFLVSALDERDGGCLEIEADQVILAAGTMENTRIYAQTLDRLAGVRVFDWPGLATKIKNGVLTRPAPWMSREHRLGDLAYLYSRQPAHRANLFFAMQDDPLGLPYVDLWWFAEQAAAHRASIRFVADGPAWTGTVTCDLGAEDDHATAVREELANDLLREWGCEPADLSVEWVTSRKAAQQRKTDVPVRYRNWLGLSDHESGTLALGEHLDDRFMSRTMPGIFVAGPAVFPRMGAANPGLTILALAGIVARGVLEDLSPRQSSIITAERKQ